MVRTRLTLLLALIPVLTRAANPGGGETTLDTARLETVEEVTEGFANALFDLSLRAREGDARALEPWLAESLSSAALPAPAAELAPEWKWIRARAWTVRAVEAPASRASTSAALQSTLDRWVSLEDVRFKLKSAAPREGGLERGLDAKFKMWIVGRNREGRLEWLRGTGEISGVREGARWSVDRLVFAEARSLVADRDLFADVAGPAGVAERDPTLAERGHTGLLAHGVAVADVDRDGLIDVFTTGLSRNFLYLSRGDGTFREAAREARVHVLGSPGVAPLFLDMDGDGDQDLFVSSVGRQSLLENRLVPDGRLAFRDVSSRARVDVDSAGFSAAAGDVNRDGRPDVYVACYNHYGQVVPDSWDAATNGLPNLLFLNQGDGTFREAAREWGVADSRWSYSASFADVDGDADLDLAVANDFGPGAALYRNEGTRFTDVTKAAGIERPGYGMGVSFGDYDADGDLDLEITTMSSNAGNRVVGRFAPGVVPDEARLRSLFAGNFLYRNDGGTFTDVSAKAGPFGASWAWGGGFLDADNDGREDLYTPNGFLSGALLHDT